MQYTTTALLILLALFNLILLLVLVFESRRIRTITKKHAEESVQREEFTATMVHELRSPLAAIRSSSDVLIKQWQNIDAEQISHVLGEIRSSSESLLKIVNDLLDISKIETGKIELFKADADINQVITDVYDHYSDLSKDKGVSLLLNLEKTTVCSKVDKDKLKQVLNNLVSNALKFTSPSDTIFITSKKTTENIEISVADTGPGIDDETKTKLFNRFVQAKQNLKKKEKSTGLGLSIAKGIVEAHGGKIWIEDNKPKGAKFIFTLPC